MNRFLPIVVSLVLALFVTTLSAGEIRCEGDYQYHLQGFASDGQSIFWTFTNVLVKTDMNGKKLQEVPVPSHHGDCCVVDGKVYVGTHLGWPSKGRTSWIYVYNCSDLSFVEKFNIPEYDYDGVDGITFKDGFFYVCVGKDPDNPRPYNIILKMTPKFEKVAVQRPEHDPGRRKLQRRFHQKPRVQRRFVRASRLGKGRTPSDGRDPSSGRANPKEQRDGRFGRFSRWKTRRGLISVTHSKSFKKSKIKGVSQS